MRGVFVLLFILFIAGTSFAGDGWVGIISDVEGEVSIVRGGGEMKAGIGMYVQIGDRVVTKAESRIKIMMMDDSLLSIAPKTEFSIDEYFVDTQKGHRKSLIGLIRGKILFYVNKVFSKQESKFEVRTKTSIAGVRGTKFFYEYDEGEFIGVFDGEVELVSKDKSLRITEGKCVDSKKEFVISHLDPNIVEQYNNAFKIKKGKTQVAILNNGTRTGGESLVDVNYRSSLKKGDSGLAMPVEGKSQEGYSAEDVVESSGGRGEVENYGGNDTEKSADIHVGLIPLRIRILLPFVKLKR